METIGIHVREPQKRSERCYALIFKCHVTDCPLLAENRCINASTFDRCVYGKVNSVRGWTPRAKKYHPFLKEWREKARDYSLGAPSSEHKRITFISDYVWLPYSHMNNHDGEKRGIPFESYSGFGSSGTPFMKREDFTPEMIVKLVEFRPQAIFGGTINAYHKEQVPKFLRDLREVAPNLYEQARSLKPDIDEIAGKAEPQPVRLGWLQGIDWSGNAVIDGRECFVYGNIGTIQFEVDELEEFPHAQGKIRVKVSLPPDTHVYPDESHWRYMNLLNRAKKQGGTAE